MPGPAKLFLPLGFSNGTFVCVSYNAFMLPVPPVIFLYVFTLTALGLKVQMMKPLIM